MRRAPASLRWTPGDPCRLARRAVAVWLSAGGALGAQERPSAVALLNATVVDVEAGRAVPGQVVVTGGDRIVAVGPAGSVAIPAAARRIDLRGQWVIPGLWDMHVHLGAPSTATVEEAAGYYGSLFLAHGVTAIRGLGGDAALFRALDAFGRIGAFPRAAFSGEKLGGGSPVVPGAPARVSTVEQMRESLGLLQRQGLRIVKLAPEYPIGLWRATFEACAAAGMRCVSHVPAADTAVWLSVPGGGHFEHLFHLLEHLATVPAARLFAEAAEYRQPRLWHRVLYRLGWRRRPADPVERVVAVRDASKDAAFFAALERSGAWVTPTLLLHHRLAGPAPLPAAATDPAFTLIEAAPVPPARPAATVATWSMWNRLVPGMHRSGVRLLAGTDFFPDQVPGAALQAELVLLQSAGLQPAEVLRIATLNAARWFAASDSMGAVRPGRVADLVVLSADPLRDVRHVGSIAAVMTRGRWLGAAALDSLRRHAAATAARLRRSPRAETGARREP